MKKGQSTINSFVRTFAETLEDRYGRRINDLHFTSVIRAISMSLCLLYWKVGLVPAGISHGAESLTSGRVQLTTDS